MTEKPGFIGKLQAGDRNPNFFLRFTSAIAVFFVMASATVLCVTLDSCKPASPLPPVGQYRVVEVPADYVASQGELLVLPSDRIQSGKKLALPLIQTDVAGRIDGFLARVDVTQKFVNLLDSTIEAVYTFPLPENAAVDSMIMTIGNRRIKGIIRERGEARAMYEQARRDGKTASLLEQERPNIFTQSVANILKNDTILVTISYVAELKYKDGNYQFVFPMVVGPRYIPGSPVKPAVHGTEKPTDQVQDADKITPPLVPPGMRSGHDISLRLTVNAETDINELSCPSHKIRDVMNADRTRTIEILSGDNIPNKDFILDYSVGQKEINSVVLCHRQKDDGFFQLIMTPQLSVKKSDIFPRELVFVVDNSGSMGGFPVEKCKEVMTLCLRKMRSSDVFRLIKFSGSTGELSPAPLEATAANVARAVAYVDRMSGGGGTEMMSAINAIFDAPQSDGRRRLVFFLTDGFVGNEAGILTTIRERLGTTRVFGLGVGSSVNRYLIEGMAYNGRGVSMFIRQDGDAEKTMKEFYSYVDAPVLTDIQLHFKGVKILDAEPCNLPDLFAGQPLSIIAKYGHPGNGTLIIEGNLAGNQKFLRTIDVVLPKEETGNSVLATLWARRKIAEIGLLGSQMMGNIAYTPDSVKEKVTRLGLTYRIMTEFTSFVAVDDAIRNKSGKWVTKVQTVDLPEGVSPASQPEYRYYGSQDARTRVVQNGVFGAISGKCGGAGIGYGAGYGSGFGGGASASGVDALLQGMGGLKSYRGSATESRGSLQASEPKYVKGCTLTGGRSRQGIMRVVMQNIASLKYEYSKRLREKPDLAGKIVVKFVVDPKGNVILCEIVESTMKDPDLEKRIIEKIKRWVFDKVDDKIGTTEVVYPFVFAR